MLLHSLPSGVRSVELRGGCRLGLLVVAVEHVALVGDDVADGLVPHAHEVGELLPVQLLDVQLHLEGAVGRDHAGLHVAHALDGGVDLRPVVLGDTEIRQADVDLASSRSLGDVTATYRFDVHVSSPWGLSDGTISVYTQLQLLTIRKVIGIICCE